MPKFKKENISKVFYVGISKYSFRAGEPAVIIGVAMIAEDNRHPRPCFHIRFKNEEEDYVPINDRDNYKLISEQDVKLGQIPQINHEI